MLPDVRRNRRSPLGLLAACLTRGTPANHENPPLPPFVKLIMSHNFLLDTGVGIVLI